MAARGSLMTVTLNPALDVTAWVDAWEPQVKLASRRLKRDPGGGGINVARMARRWLERESVEALAALGGPTGARLRDLLDAEDVPCAVFPIAEETRESWQITLPDGGFYRIIHPGPRWRAQELAELGAVLAERLRTSGPQWVVFSGSLPAGVAPAEMARLVALVREAAPSARIAVDTRGEALVAALEAGVDLVKPDRREMAELAGRLGHGRGDLLTLARRMVAAGRTRTFCYTLGPKGLVVVREGGAWRWEPPAVALVSLAGAGDFLLGTLIARVMRGDDWIEASRLAMATAAATAATEGTSPPAREAVLDLAARVRRGAPEAG
ncbi:MAG: phosphofructokinase [Rhodothalassiaceae bacterium]|nr:MAG: phosphofructokinase [Rhodothalassiaceae bacterium]